MMSCDCNGFCRYKHYGPAQCCHGEACGFGTDREPPKRPTPALKEALSEMEKYAISRRRWERERYSLPARQIAVYPEISSMWVDETAPIIDETVRVITDTDARRAGLSLEEVERCVRSASRRRPRRRDKVRPCKLCGQMSESPCAVDEELEARIEAAKQEVRASSRDVHTDFREHDRTQRIQREAEFLLKNSDRFIKEAEEREKKVEEPEKEYDYDKVFDEIYDDRH